MHGENLKLISVLPCLCESAIRPCPEPEQSSPCPPIPFLQDPFRYCSLYA